MEILIGGDFYISDDYKGKKLIDKSVTELFHKSDFSIVNLETSITVNNPQNKIIKTGPHLRTSAATIIPYLKELKIDLVTLANNHIMDYGKNGLNDTFDALNKNYIKHVGAGQHPNEAAKPFIIEKEGLKIAILNFAENEWSIVEDSKPGANPLDIIDNVKQIKNAKKNYDKVICIIHGGHEYYNLPDPKLKKQYQFYVDNGADAIICHHTHCISGYETYNNAIIFYGLGNFLFTKISQHEDWYTGIIITLNIKKNVPITFNFAICNQDQITFKISILNGDKYQEYLDKISNYNDIIEDKFNLESAWNKYVQDKSDQYLNYINPLKSMDNRFLRSMAYRFTYFNKIINKGYLKLLYNLIRCESHNNVLSNVIKKEIYGK